MEEAEAGRSLAEEGELSLAWAPGWWWWWREPLLPSLGLPEPQTMSGKGPAMHGAAQAPHSSPDHGTRTEHS